jgi:GntR family carbon starvation induced transcriptional regulator
MLNSSYAMESRPAGKTQVGGLITRLRRDIIAGVLAPGSRLKIGEVAQRYEAGVIPTREALSRLVSSGLVVAYEQRGFRVAPISSEELHDLASLRKSLETRALRESMEHGDLEWEMRLIAAHHRMSRLPPQADVGDLGFAQEWVTAHREFHMALLSGCRSKWLMQFVDVLSDQMNRYRHLSMRGPSDDTRDVASEHKALLDAALAHDIENACSLLIEHFSITEANALSALRERATTP